MSANKLFGKDISISSTTDASGAPTVGSISTLGGVNVSKKIIIGSSYSTPQIGSTTGAFITMADNTVITDTTSTSTSNVAFWGSFLGNPTIAAVNPGVVYPTSATLYIDAAPTAGNNVTLQNPWSIYVSSGNVFFGNNLAIRTSTSSQALDVNGNINFTGNLYQNGSVYSGSTQWGSTGANIYFNTGNVAIGTTSPGFALDVRTTTSGAYTYSGNFLSPNITAGQQSGIVIGKANSGNNVCEIRHFHAGDGSNQNMLRIGSSGLDNIMSIRYDGNVGIGTTAPGSALHVTGTIDATPVGTGVHMGTDSVNNASIIQINQGGNTSGISIVDFGYSNINFVSRIIHDNSTKNLGFRVNSTQSDVLTLTSSGNIGIGTTTPSTLVHLYSNTDTFCRVDAGGGTGQAGIRLVAGSGATNRASRIDFYNNIASTTVPRWTLINDYDQTGLNDFRIVNTNLTNTITITSTGNVGIGTTAPLTALHVVQTSGTASMSIRNASSTGNSSIDFFNHSNAYFGSIGFGNTASSSGPAFRNTLFLYHNNQDAVFVGTGTTERMRVTASGNVGIGNSSPSFTLDINGNLRTSGPGGVGTNGSVLITGGDSFGHSLYIASSSGTQKRIGFNHTGTVGNIWAYDYGASATQNLILQFPGGNVGIGTTSPSERLHNVGRFRSETNAGTASITIDPFGVSTAGPQIQFGSVGAADYMIIGTYNNVNNIDTKNRPLYMFNSAGSTLFYGTTGGNVGIGTTSPQSALHVAGSSPTAPTGTGVYMGVDVLANPHIQLNSTSASYIDFSTSGTDYLGRIIYYNTSGSLSGSLNFNVASSTSIGMSLTSAGTLLISGDIGAFASISDRTLKTNITDISPDTALQTVKTLRPVTFNWRDDIFNVARRGEFDSGFIAQEVEEVIPHAVGTYDTVDHQNTYKNMRHERIIPYLVGSIQKLEETVTQLKDRIAFLESK